MEEAKSVFWENLHLLYKTRNVIDGFLYTGACCCRQISEAEVCHFAKQGSSSCSAASEQGDHSLASSVCGELLVSKATFLGLYPCCAPGGTFNVWLKNSNIAGGATKIASTQECEQRMAKEDVPGARNPI